MILKDSEKFPKYTNKGQFLGFVLVLKLEKRPFFKIDFDSLMYIVPETKPKTKNKFWVSSRVLNTGDSGIFIFKFFKFDKIYIK